MNVLARAQPAHVHRGLKQIHNLNSKLARVRWPSMRLPGKKVRGEQRTSSNKVPSRYDNCAELPRG